MRTTNVDTARCEISYTYFLFVRTNDSFIYTSNYAYNDNLYVRGTDHVIKGVPLATEPGNEDIAAKFEQEYVRCVRNEVECFCSVCR